MYLSLLSDSIIVAFQIIVVAIIVVVVDQENYSGLFATNILRANTDNDNHHKISSSHGFNKESADGTGAVRNHCE